MKEKGVIMLGSAPNATAVNAELDNMFGHYKGLCLKATQRVFNKKLHRRMLDIRRRRVDPDFEVPNKAVGLDQVDVAAITNGIPGEDDSLSPFKTCFTKPHILKSWSNIGFIPFTRKCLENKQVRREINETNPQDSKLEELQLEYEEHKDGLKAAGLNEDAFDIELQVVQQIRRKPTEEDQVKDLVANKKAFSSGEVFLHTGNLVFNSSTVIKA